MAMLTALFHSVDVGGSGGSDGVLASSSSVAGWASELRSERLASLAARGRGDRGAMSSGLEGSDRTFLWWMLLFTTPLAHLLLPLDFFFFLWERFGGGSAGLSESGSNEKRSL